MSVFHWNPKYSVGHPLIDEQHRRLFDLLDQLHSAMKSQRGAEAIDETLLELLHYTEVHFAAEERLMREMDYAELERHCQEHQFLIAQVTSMRESRERGERLATFELLTFIGEWIIDHVGSTDSKLYPLCSPQQPRPYLWSP